MFPGSGLLRGLKVDGVLHRIVNDLTFADTLIPLRIVASDLSHDGGVVFEQGRLLDAIRASISIPGVFRPVSHNGSTLIDGGITDPVPVDVLAKLALARLSRSTPFQYRGHEETGTADDSMHETGPLLETPTSIINYLMRSMHSMQSRMAEDACSRADVVLRPSASEAVLV